MKNPIIITTTDTLHTRKDALKHITQADKKRNKPIIVTDGTLHIRFNFWPRTIDKIITKVNGAYGAPHGRPDKGTKPTNKKVYDCAVPMSDPAYDKGGAYWGIGAQLRVEYTKDLSYVHFYRIDEIIYTTESGTEYTHRDALRVAKGNRTLLDMLVYIAYGRHLETVFEDLIMEEEIDENGKILRKII
jgi:hypothetical protein